MMDANGTVDPLVWQFQGQDGRWISEDDDQDLKRSLLDYFLAAFPPAALKRNQQEFTQEWRERDRTYPYQQESTQEWRERDQTRRVIKVLWSGLIDHKI
jgi:hypothetical protein